MPETPLAKKLGIKPGFQLLILNAPDNYLALLGTLPEGTSVSTQLTDEHFDFVQLFVPSIASLNEYAHTAIARVKPGGLLWIAYPKKSGKIKTDITRDIGWDVVHKDGWDGVTLIAVDETWSAMRFRPLTEIPSREGMTRVERNAQRKESKS